ncbi:MAG: ABC transporter permease [Phycisphaerae bacterium]|jgi:ABC-2 type transport system permease protein
MRKILTIAIREFLAVVATKGFVLGLIIPPIILAVTVAVLPRLMNQKPPPVVGTIAIIDQSGLVAPRLEDAFSREKMQQRREEKFREASAEVTKRTGMALPDPTKATAQTADGKPAQASDPFSAAMNNPVANAQMQQAMGTIPELQVITLPPETDINTIKDQLRQADSRARVPLDANGKVDESAASTLRDQRLVLVVIPKDVVTLPTAASGTESNFASYDFFLAPRLDPEVAADIRDQANRAIVDARLAANQLDVNAVRTLTKRPDANQQIVTADGARKQNEAAAMLVPGAFMFLLWMSVFVAGQYLLTSTIEEKGSRVMEVLLSAASPLELMIGKIIGKGAVGLMILLLYAGAGLLALVAATMLDLIAWQNVVYLLVYFVIAYFIVASLMAAIGAAVTELAEAQALMTPINLVLMIPMLLWLPIMRNPNGSFAQVCSFIPLINPFVMVLRISGPEQIPFWQILSSIIIGVITVCVLVWMSAKIFRVGVLMYGKPPDFPTLLKWVRMA